MKYNLIFFSLLLTLSFFSCEVKKQPGFEESILTDTVYVQETINTIDTVINVVTTTQTIDRIITNNIPCDQSILNSVQDSLEYYKKWINALTNKHLNEMNNHQAEIDNLKKRIEVSDNLLDKYVSELLKIPVVTQETTKPSGIFNKKTQNRIIITNVPGVDTIIYDVE